VTSDSYHRTRFRADHRRRTAWGALWRYYFSRLISPSAAVLDLGAGHGDFINSVRCDRRYAIDVWPGMPQQVDSGVVTEVGSITDLSFVPDESVDFVMASNVFEHLQRDELLVALAQVRTKLKKTGELCVIQPNYRFAYREYFDDYTHVAVFSHHSLRDLLESEGFAVTVVVPRFLPLQIDSRWPVLPPLVGLYLASPFKPFGKQMLIRARRV
jgi:ubiquinone/menaquinone biosynthesis C-methylase UbiE